MNDRELLELAAKAADAGIVFYGECWRSQNVNEWNPLTDDGDALRLAVNLKMEIAIHETYTGVIDGNLIGGQERHRDDPYSATRRAIVRAAAAIGEAMP